MRYDWKILIYEAGIISKLSFGQWLKQRRKSLDLTREELAARVGCAPNTLYKFEADERQPSKQIAALLAEHLNIPAGDHETFIHFARGEISESEQLWGTPFHPPTNLPTPSTPLIGRDDDADQIHQRLRRTETRLITLTGAPGIGKTRLALQVAARTLDDFSDGVFFIALASVTDASLVAATIIATLGIQGTSPLPALDRLKGFLRDKQMLLVLDNFEQILAAAPQIAELLSDCLWLKILITSRAPLRIRYERQIPVAPLAFPDASSKTETIMRYSAVELFMERTQAVKPDFSLTDETAPTVAAICARLDGLPLAIELISARIKMLPPAALLSRLHGRLMLQSDGLRDIEPRHKTLNAAIDWSYQLLSLEEQILIGRLGLFVGGWTLAAAEAVCMEGLSLNLLDGMASLLDKNLIKRDSESGGEPRFTMLETIREFALEQIAAKGELDALRQRHADYFTTFAESAEAVYFRADPVRLLSLLQSELDNFRAALTSRQSGLRLAVALHEFWMRRGYRSEGIRWMQAGLSQQESVPAPLSDEDRLLRARALDRLATYSVWQGDFETPAAQYEASLAIFRQLGRTAEIAGVMGRYGTFFQMQGDYERTDFYTGESLTLYRKIGDVYGTAWALILRGWLNHTTGRLQEAASNWNESLAMFRSQKDMWGTATLLINTAMVAMELNDLDRAADHLSESLTLYQKLGERWQILSALELSAVLIAARAQQSDNPHLDSLRAARLLGAVTALRGTLGSPLMQYFGENNERIVSTLRDQLGDAKWETAQAEGRSRTLDQAVNDALTP